MWTLGAASGVLVGGAARLHSAGPPVDPQIDRLMLFGFIASLLAIFCWVHRRESRLAGLAFAISLGAAAVYGFLAGAWPLAMIEAVWTIRALWRCRFANSSVRGKRSARSRWRSNLTPAEFEESRLSRLFGPLE